MIIKQKLAGNIDFDYKWYDIYNCDDHDIRLLKDDFDWVIITVGSVIVMAILLWYLRRHNML